MRADGLPYIPSCPICGTDTPRFQTVGLAHWQFKCRDKDCGFKLKHESEDTLREQWGRLQPAAPDPIAEVEKHGARIVLKDSDVVRLLLFVPMHGEEEIGDTGSLTDLRAAAARLLSRVKGVSDGE